MISVIMSAYNAEKTIKRAIDSVLKQSLKDLELIIINDCSTDSTEDIILSYKDARIKYIKHEINQGAGCARDTGVKQAKGEFIKFLDSDDYLSIDCLEKMYITALYYNADIVIGGQIIETSNGSIIKFIAPEKTLVEVGKDRFTPDKNQAKRYLNGFLVKTSLFDTIDYSHKRYCEDTPTLFKLVYLAKVIVQIPYSGYHYTQNEGSLVHTCTKEKTIVYRCLAAVSNLTFLKERGETQDPLVFKKEYKKVKQIKNVYKNFPEEMKEIDSFKEFLDKSI